MQIRQRSVLIILALAALVAFPWAAQALDQGFYIGFASRVLIFALLAASLNLLIGVGGMISFGHAAFFGAGAYTVGILAHELSLKAEALVPGTESALIAWPLALAVAALMALVIGAISLRTRGVYFIMITLAFAQMFYYLFVSLKRYGGDDGLTLTSRSQIPGLNLADDVTFYYVVLGVFLVLLALLVRLVESRFGTVIRGIKQNEARMQAIGYPVYRYKLVCFVIAGAIAGLAGAMAANQNGFASPNLLHWTQSATVMVMVILGGMGTIYGAVAGAVVMLVLEEVLAAYSQHWPLALGLILLAVVFFAPRGLAGLAVERGRK